MCNKSKRATATLAWPCLHCCTRAEPYLLLLLLLLPYQPTRPDRPEPIERIYIYRIVFRNLLSLRLSLYIREREKDGGGANPKSHSLI